MGRFDIVTTLVCRTVLVVVVLWENSVSHRRAKEEDIRLTSVETFVVVDVVVVVWVTFEVLIGVEVVVAAGILYI